MLKAVAVAAVLATTALVPLPSSAANLLSPQDEKAYREAFLFADKDKWRDAHGWAAKAREDLPAKVLRWIELTQPRADVTFADITGFMRDNPDWPQMALLQRRAEEAITAATPPGPLLQWFAVYPPVTSDGMMAYANALASAGQMEKAVAVARQAWVEGNFGSKQEQDFLGRWADVLTAEDHVARLDRLIWDRQEVSAERMLARVSPEMRTLAQARLALYSGKGNVDALVDAVPRALQDDPGLIFERVRYRRKNDMDDGAMELLRHPNRNQGKAELWWDERSILARRALQRGLITQAYETARDHGQVSGSGFAEAEWMAGWIALRFLDDKQVALNHFLRMYEGVSFPVSRARGAYWAGRAYEALGDGEKAALWYGNAAQHVTTFYGQLAEGRLRQNNAWPLPADPLPTAEDIKAFEKNELTRAVRMLAELGQHDQIRPFVVRLAEQAKTPGAKALAANLAASLGRPDVAVTVARRTEREGVTLIASGFPIPSIEVQSPEKALVLGLIRQESGFHHEAVSSVGARGLMQLMPGTAKEVARKIKAAYKPDELTRDPSYNVQLGTQYLNGLLNSFNGSYVLTLAAYNAGPGRVRGWIRDYGDPRTGEMDVVDWIETIPFTETRNYVQRVLEAVQVYRRRMGATDLHLSLDRDLKR